MLWCNQWLLFLSCVFSGIHTFQLVCCIVSQLMSGLSEVKKGILLEHTPVWSNTMCRTAPCEPNLCLHWCTVVTCTKQGSLKDFLILWKWVIQNEHAECCLSCRLGAIYPVKEWSKQIRCRIPAMLISVPSFSGLLCVVCFTFRFFFCHYPPLPSKQLSWFAVTEDTKYSYEVMKAVK